VPGSVVSAHRKKRFSYQLDILTSVVEYEKNKAIPVVRQGQKATGLKSSESAVD